MEINFKTCRVEELPRVLAQIGFVKTPQRYFKHPDCDHLYIEFPTGPVEVQGSPVGPDEISYDGVKIKILSPPELSFRFIWI